MAASSDLRFSISSAAMANLIMTASVSSSEASGFIVGEVQVCTTKLTTDHEAAETVQRNVVVQKIVPFGNQKRFADFLRGFDGDEVAALQSELEGGSQVVGYFEALRSVPHKLTLTERCLLKRLAKQPVITQCGSFFVRVTTCEHEQLTRMTTQYGVTHVSLSGRQRDLPFEVINLGDTSHGEYKRCKSGDHHLLSSDTFTNLRPDAWLREIDAARVAIMQQLDDEVNTACKSQLQLVDARREYNAAQASLANGVDSTKMADSSRTTAAKAKGTSVAQQLQQREAKLKQSSTSKAASSTIKMELNETDDQEMSAINGSENVVAGTGANDQEGSVAAHVTDVKMETDMEQQPSIIGQRSKRTKAIPNSNEDVFEAKGDGPPHTHAAKKQKDPSTATNKRNGGKQK